MLNPKRGFTLIELIIAISLVGMIILAIVAVDVASRRFVNTSDFEARAQNQIGPVLEMIAKDVSRAVGGGLKPGINQTNATNIGARLDINSAGTPNNTPWDYSDDTWAVYGLVNNTIRKKECPESGWPCPPASADLVVASYITNATTFNITNGTVVISITAKLPEADSRPVTLETTVFPRSNSAN